MKYVTPAFNAVRTLISKALAYTAIGYGIVVAVPALLVFGLAVIIAPISKDPAKPKLTPEQVTARIQNMTRLLRESGLDNSLKVDVNAQISKR